MSFNVLQEKYLLSDAAKKKIVDDLFEELTQDKDNHLYQCNMIFGQQASGKSTLTDIMCSRNPELININGDIIRGKHPNIEELKELYPTQYIGLLYPDWNFCKEELLKRLMEDGYSFNVEFAMDDIEKIKSQINRISSASYKIDCYLMAVSQLECNLRVLERYFEQIKEDENPRLVDVERQQSALDQVRKLFSVIDLDEINRIAMVDMFGIDYPISKDCLQSEIIMDTYCKWSDLYVSMENVQGRIDALQSDTEHYKKSISDDMMARVKAHMLVIKKNLAQKKD